jgi:hypothetical protein
MVSQQTDGCCNVGTVHGIAKPGRGVDVFAAAPDGIAVPAPHRVCARTLRRAVDHRELTALHPLPDGQWVFNDCAQA